MNQADGTTHGRLSPRFRLWLVDADESAPFGHGKWQLLAAIEREGSLSAAAADLGISYRKAWGGLRRAEELLGVKLIETRRGGRDGGDTHLTADGQQWLRAYSRFRSRVERSVARAFDASFKDLQR
jgi:molybdate transport repressor ModE-like protein